MVSTGTNTDVVRSSRARRADNTSVTRSVESSEQRSVDLAADDTTSNRQPEQRPSDGGDAVVGELRDAAIAGIVWLKTVLLVKLKRHGKFAVYFVTFCLRGGGRKRLKSNKFAKKRGFWKNLIAKFRKNNILARTTLSTRRLFKPRSAFPFSSELWSTSMEGCQLVRAEDSVKATSNEKTPVKAETFVSKIFFNRFPPTFCCAFFFQLLTEVICWHVYTVAWRTILPITSESFGVGE